jgi:hypothetical protein
MPPAAGHAALLGPEFSLASEDQVISPTVINPQGSISIMRAALALAFTLALLSLNQASTVQAQSPSILEIADIIHQYRSREGLKCRPCAPAARPTSMLKL